MVEAILQLGRLVLVICKGLERLDSLGALVALLVHLAATALCCQIGKVWTHVELMDAKDA